MRAFIVPEFGQPGSIGERARPEPGEGELLVRVRAASVNAMDCVVRAGYAKDFMEHRFPLTLGIDYAGTVETVGAGVEGIAAGDEVFGVIGKPHAGEGSFAEFVTVAAGLAAKRPEGLAAEVASSLPLAGGTALAALDALGVKSGDTIAIIGAGGGVGSFATSLAARRGLSVIAVTRAELADHVRGLGATDVVDYAAGDVTDQLRQLAPDGVAGIIDVYHDAQALLAFVPAVKPGGTIASPVAMGADELFADQPVSVALVAAAVDRAAELGDLAASGAINVPLEVLPLDRAAEALDRQSTRQTHGKLVLTIGEG